LDVYFEKARKSRLYYARNLVYSMADIAEGDQGFHGLTTLQRGQDCHWQKQFKTIVTDNSGVTRERLMTRLGAVAYPAVKIHSAFAASMRRPFSADRAVWDSVSSSPRGSAAEPRRNELCLVLQLSEG